MKPRIVCISQARMTSTRLPGKVMLPLHGKPLLAWHLERLKRSALLDVVAVATVDAAESKPIEDLCAGLGVPVTRGSEDDVLARYRKCAAEHDAEVVVRVTSDCPLIDPALVDVVIADFLKGGADYVSQDGYPRGFDVEVFSRESLELAFREATTTHQREHVTPFLYTHPDRMVVRRVGGGRGACYRVCVDQIEDFQLVDKILGALGQTPFGWADVVRVLDEHPDWVEINRHVAQKTI